ncbi:MAG: O-antigen ligase family protein [Rubrivivax sp.]|nr:O-antigen ligase family protein [Rubrivivax sp.]
MKALFFAVLIAGIGNTVLRPGLENPYTLYRLLAPLGLLAVSMANPGLAAKALAAYAVFAVYNFALATAYGGDFSQLLPSLVHYLYLFIPLVMMLHLRSRDARFERSFLTFVQAFYVFLLLNLLLEMAVGSYYPNLEPDESEDGSVRAFFWNQNDLAVVLCVIGWIALTLDRYRGFTRLFVVLATVALLYLNDSKAALISFLFISLPVWAVQRASGTMRIPPALWAGVAASLAAAALAALFAFSDVDIQFANDVYSVGELLLQPIVNIVTLQASGEDLGSLNNRTDAAIFVVIEYLRTFGLGLGAGGSWLVLTLPQYQLGGAQSPHNALLQFVVDFGYPVLLGYLWLTGWALRRLFRHKLPEPERLKVMAILSFPMLGLSQSGAIVTNYFFFTAVYFIWLYGRRRAAGRLAVPRPPAAALPAAA